MVQWLTNPTRNREVAGSIPGLENSTSDTYKEESAYKESSIK